MKTIDKTSTTKPNEWDYGTILKCWKDDPEQYDLYRIARSHDRHDHEYELDILHDCSGLEDNVFGGIAMSKGFLKKMVFSCYDHVKPVNATITIEDLEQC